jgi:hypothetical protein
MSDKICREIGCENVNSIYRSCSLYTCHEARRAAGVKKLRCHRPFLRILGMKQKTMHNLKFF